MIATRNLFPPDLAVWTKLRFSVEILRGSCFSYSPGFRAPCSDLDTGDVWMPYNIAGDTSTTATFLADDVAIIDRKANLARFTIGDTASLKLAAI
jgi:hypothetical protein